MDILYGLQYRYKHLNNNDICLKLCQNTAFTIFIQRLIGHVFFKLLKRICEVYADEDSEQGR